MALNSGGWNGLNQTAKVEETVALGGNGNLAGKKTTRLNDGRKRLRTGREDTLEVVLFTCNAFSTHVSRHLSSALVVRSSRLHWKGFRR